MPPIYSKTNPADTPILTLALTSKTAAALEGGGSGRHAAGAQDFAAAGRGPGQHQRRPEAGGAHPGEPHALASYGLNLEDLRTAPSWPPTSIRPRETSTGRTSPTRSAPTTSCFRADDYRLVMVAYRNGAPGEADRRGRRDRRRRKRPPGRVDERDAGGDHEHSAAARRQHHSVVDRIKRCCRSSRPRCRHRST
jgi:hypothetical protein